ncbi:MAG: hypothetical protein V7K32_08080 [Nostoc sp.]|uniref:hypothetical protein n=1 Tax=Nostoc sp. TaxID=1180 RepID=UPI002FF7A1C4
MRLLKTYKHKYQPKTYRTANISKPKSFSQGRSHNNLTEKSSTTGTLESLSFTL